MTEIHIVPVRFSNTSLLKVLVKELQRLFKPLVILDNISFDIENAYSEARGQYYSTQIIADLSIKAVNIKGRVMALTEADIFIPVLTFIFGEAQLDGKYSLVSVCRLHEEFYSTRSDDKLLLKRTMKEVLHELGHNFGLRHCDNWDCVMHSSQGIEEVDIKGGLYCKKCAKFVSGYKL